MANLQLLIEGMLIIVDIEQMVCSQDNKLLLVKSSAMVATGGPPKLIAGPPEMQKQQTDLPSPSIPIISEANPFADLAQFQEPETINNDIDFTRAEDFFQLETQIDVKKDHSVLKTALTSPEGSFMNDLISGYAIPSHRLAFIQQISPNSSLSNTNRNAFMVVSGQDANREYIVSCQGCGEMFSCLNKFQRHILTHTDPENKKFLCQICGKRFNRADHLNRHSMLHGDVTHKCLLCGEEFDRASHLDRHRRKNHPPAGQDPSQTPPTTPLPRNSSDFTTPPGTVINTTEPPIGNNLHLLAAVATPEDAQELTPNQILQLEASRVVSEILVSEVSTNQRSQANKKPLSEVERPFECEVCERKFIRSTHLRRHMRIHTGEKPFACHICGRKYARGDYLRAHIQGHRRDRVHKCKHCNEIFHDLTRFANHCRVMHLNEEDGPDEGSNKDVEQPIIVQDVQEMSFSVSNETTISSDNMIYSTPMVAAPPSVAGGRGENGQGQVHNNDISLSAAVPHFSPELLQVFHTSNATGTPPAHHQAESSVILQNGTLSNMPESENDVAGVLAGKTQVLDALQFFITGTGPFLGNEHT